MDKNIGTKDIGIKNKEDTFVKLATSD